MLFKFDFCLIMNFNYACCQAHWLRLSYILRHVFGTESISWEKHAIQFTHVTVGDCAMHHLIVITHLVVRTSKIGMWEVQESYYHRTKLCLQKDNVFKIWMVAPNINVMIGWDLRARVILDTIYFVKNWKYYRKIIFKCVNSTVGSIFNIFFE